jgi:hypothetical protein
LFSLIVQGIYLLVLRRWDVLRRWVKVLVGMGVLTLPLAYQIYWVAFVRGYRGTASRSDLSAVFERFLPTLLFGDNVILLWVGIVVVGLWLTVLAWLIRWRRSEAWFLPLWGVVPVVLLYFVSTRSGLFLPRYVISVVPAFLLSFVFVVDVVLAAGWGRRVVVFLLVLVVSAFCFLSLHEIRDYFFHDPPKALNWRGLVAYLEPRTTTQDVIVSGAPDPALEYYYRGQADLYYLPADNSQPTEDFERWLVQYQGIFVLAGTRTTELERFLQANAQPIGGDTRPNVVQYRPWVVNPAEIQHPLAVQFGDVAILRGYTLLEGETGGKILLLYWQPLRQTETDYSVLAHVVTEVAEPGPVPAAVLDHGIANSVISTRVWQPDALYRDPVALPPDIPPGRYILRIGLYETNSGQKLPTPDADYGGRYPIGDVIVR